jgi:uncharacterized repeat protein (TIGR01451 family)
MLTKMPRRTVSAFATLVVILISTLVFSPQVKSFALAAEPATGSPWEIVASPSTATMYALDMVDATNGWTGGMAGFVFHYNGTMWVGFPTSFIYVIKGMDMVDANLGWATTWQGRMVRYDGTSWTPHSQPATSWIDDVLMLSATSGWAVGGIGDDGQGTILRYNAGADTWQPVACPVSAVLKAIDMVNDSDGWIVGVSGTFLHWNGSSWQGASTVGGLVLTDVDMVSSSDGWAVGSGGAIYHYNGTNWAAVTSPTSNDLEGVSMVSDTEGWAVGGQGTILHYQGGAWQTVASPTNKTLYAVQMLSPTDGWATGASGVILHYHGTFDLSASTKSVSPRHASAGDELTYTLQVKNSGVLPAPSVVVTDAIPAGTIYVSGSASTSQGTIQGTNPLVVSVGDVAVDGVVTITFRVTVQNQGQSCWFVPNEAIISVGGDQLTRQVTTSVGDCNAAYLPLLLRQH